MYIFTTLKFPTYNFDFHLLTKSVNAKYCYLYIIYIYIYVYIHDFTLHLPESRPTIQRDHSASQNRTFLTLYAHTCWEDDTILPSRI